PENKRTLQGLLGAFCIHLEVPLTPFSARPTRRKARRATPPVAALPCIPRSVQEVVADRPDAMANTSAVSDRLTDAQWETLRPLCRKPSRAGGRARPICEKY